MVVIDISFACYKIMKDTNPNRGSHDIFLLEEDDIIILLYMNNVFVATEGVINLI